MAISRKSQVSHSPRTSPSTPDMWYENLPVGLSARREVIIWLSGHALNHTPFGSSSRISFTSLLVRMFLIGRHREISRPAILLPVRMNLEKTFYQIFLPQSYFVQHLRHGPDIDLYSIPPRNFDPPQKTRIPYNMTSSLKDSSHVHSCGKHAS
jgi:hypothetical protein